MSASWKSSSTELKRIEKMNKVSSLHLFQAFGIELEYMIVDIETLDVKPIADQVFKSLTGEYVGEMNFGNVTWSNELALHVLELKCAQPTQDLVQLAQDFHEAVKQMNECLTGFNARLMPSAAHPWMDPETESFRWSHDSGDIYAAYDRIFNCKGHGWSNLQSTHINLPFCGDDEFAQLHAAIRLILPLLPALSASSPIIGGQSTGYLDKRLDFYQNNQKLIPSLTGQVIPEAVFSKSTYRKYIYSQIEQDIAPYDHDGILDPVWLNSRGAIARFDRGAIEIRIIDIQESPSADLAIANLVIASLQMLVEEKIMTTEAQQDFKTEDLYSIFNNVIRHGEHAVLLNKSYLKAFGFNQTEEVKASDFWKVMYHKLKDLYPERLGPWESQIQMILEQGSLASRVLASVNKNYDHSNLKMVYRELTDCLENNEMFDPCLEGVF
ncbi:MAG: carboxylate-amine ligase [Roseivirga sp.]|jgi:carboxylate-amine ligase